jgi:hypothetical protein
MREHDTRHIAEIRAELLKAIESVRAEREESDSRPTSIHIAGALIALACMAFGRDREVALGYALFGATIAASLASYLGFTGLKEQIGTALAGGITAFYTRPDAPSLQQGIMGLHALVQGREVAREGGREARLKRRDERNAYLSHERKYRLKELEDESEMQRKSASSYLDAVRSVHYLAAQEAQALSRTTLEIQG